MAPTMVSYTFKGETFTTRAVQPRYGGDLEQRRGCCNLVGGGQKPFITKMPAGRSLWSPRDDCASVGVGVHTQGGACSSALPLCGQASLHSPRGLFSATLPHPARSLSVDDKGAAVQRATKHPGRHLHPYQHPHSRILYASARTKLARTSRSVATRELAPSGAATHPLGIRSV